ncbi:hypothetical protein [Hymenobacter fodinae]|uniref:Uncharacterized protein n=1 Tax=Hymenobacter fodinae TaxID=2510796 RepID=A0A4Z0P8I3_9BACT|nr:hypothetical protein [Hymenobacter fodinae]TGE08275.1 hypothetical protein EU556_11175 [Hymenobacter fodinae]
MNTQLTVNRSNVPQRATTSQLQLPKNVPASIQHAAVLATQAQPQARELGPEDLADALLEPIQGVAFLLGHSKKLKKEEDLNLMADAVAELILRKFPAFRVGEICLALRRGASGEWQREGEVLLVSLPCITHWLQSYQDSTRGEAMRLLHLEQQNQQLQLAPVNMETLYPQQLADLAAGYLATGTLPEQLDLGHLMYDWLKRIGATDGFRTGAQYAAMHAEETEKMLPKSLPFDREKRRDFQSFAAALEANQWPKDHPLAKDVISNCKKRVLREYVIEHAERGTDLRSMLEQLAADARDQEAAA